jgi:serine/threonine protein kinase
VRRRLGSGGFATVWLAHDEQLDAEVAIKVLADNWAHDDSVRHRFLEEGRFLRRVESEHVVQVHDVGELEDGRPFLVLTYADRGTLADRLKQEPLPLAEAVNVVVQVGRGLQALHRRGLLHRDVKPANVLFRSTDEGERAVLSDLGLGKSLDEVSRITMPGGTPSYVAPEQAMGERLDPRADQYSLGAVAYAALTGRSPHQVDGLGAASRVEVAPPPSSLGFDLPDAIDAAIVRALDPDREKRWPDVQTFTKELVGALNETTQDFLPAAFAVRETISEDGEKTALSDANQPTILRAEPLSVEPEPTPPPKRRRGRWAVAAVLALILSGGGGYATQRYLAAQEVTTFAYSGISVELPRGWGTSVADSTWQPPGSANSYDALRISRDGWPATTAGVFVGTTDSRIAKLAIGKGTDLGCQEDGDVTAVPSTGGTKVTQRYSHKCGSDGSSTLLQRVVDTGTTNSRLIQVLVPGYDDARAAKIADSVQIDGSDAPG